jgi:hypothetical protein
MFFNRKHEQGPISDVSFPLSNPLEDWAITCSKDGFQFHNSTLSVQRFPCFKAIPSLTLCVIKSDAVLTKIQRVEKKVVMTFIPCYLDRCGATTASNPMSEKTRWETKAESSITSTSSIRLTNWFQTCTKGNIISSKAELSMADPSSIVIPTASDEVARTGSRLESLSTETLFLIFVKILVAG